MTDTECGPDLADRSPTVGLAGDERETTPQLGNSSPHMMTREGLALGTAIGLEVGQLTRGLPGHGFQLDPAPAQVDVRSWPSSIEP